MIDSMFLKNLTCMYQFTFLIVFFLLSAGNAQATNYFSWGVEGNTYVVNGVTTTFLYSYVGSSSQDCTVSHVGSCSMKILVNGATGDEPQGKELNAPIQLPFNIVGGPAVYYRFWMRLNSGWSWGSVTPKTKSSRVLGDFNGDSGIRGWTGYVQADGFNVGECDGTGAGGGCVDPGPGISYNMTN
ncbi:MAG: hypothetical protein WBO92_02825, partial [Candidatus Moraniibacteriota bacterium]